MDLHAYTKTIYDLFSINKKYIVPRFQREFSWTQEEVLELWKDIISNIKFNNNTFINQEYFIGSLVLVGEDKSTELLIVDGQQRLTTITIFLSAIIETFKSIERNDLAEGLYALVEGKDVANKPFFKLENENPKPFLQKAIQHYEKSDTAAETKEEKLLKEAYDFLFKRLQKSTLTKEFLEYSNYNKLVESSDQYCQLLEAIRDQILTLKTIYITVVSKDDAYTIFETLNARGMNLSTIDLVKNDIFKVLKQEHPNDDAKEKWAEIKYNLSIRDESINIDTFFRHFWLSKYEFTTEDKIYKSFKKLSSSHKISSSEFLDDLLYESNNYKKVTDPQITDWRLQEERKIYNSLLALSIFRVTQVRTLLIALLTVKNQKMLSLTHLAKCIKLIEKFHFTFSAVCSLRASGLERKYSKYARNFRNCGSTTKVQKLIVDLEEDLIDKTPDLNIFLENFNKIVFTNDETRYKKLIQYIFKTLESHLQSTDELEVSNITLEHILPQSARNSSYIGKIGNLLPLAGSINNKADTKKFKEKINIFRQSNLKVVSDFIRKYSIQENWTEDDINKRTKEIGELAYNQIWKLK
jgi:uncharacterized protein with ParB-like and HNH nuclease domain